MNPASTSEFRENRAKFTLAQLQAYADQWVAFSADGRRIVASGPDIAEVAKHLHEANLSLRNVVVDHIVFDSDEIFLGAAEEL